MNHDIELEEETRKRNLLCAVEREEGARENGVRGAIIFLTNNKLNNS